MIGLKGREFSFVFMGAYHLFERIPQLILTLLERARNGNSKPFDCLLCVCVCFLLLFLFFILILIIGSESRIWFLFRFICIEKED